MVSKELIREEFEAALDEAKSARKLAQKIGVSDTYIRRIANDKTMSFGPKVLEYLGFTERKVFERKGESDA